ncbi:MAG: sugar phosphate isomerase/epimerase [Clostridiales bacterium]|nr:sugar phosphate isomerase/epimerase [Clostridiales bacterium]
MKISFSTLGCPKWHWKEILAAAADLNYDGIELRGLGNTMFMPRAEIFSPSKFEQTNAELKKRNVEISCITSDILLHKDGMYYLSATLQYIALAHDLDCKYIRMLADENPWPSDEVEYDLVLSRLRKVAPVANALGVVLLVESNGVFADTKLLRKLILDVNSPAVKVLWDINHPVRYYNESPAETYANIGEFVCHIHVKDSIIENGKIKYKMLGYGDLPINECFALLKSHGFDGFVSLEWTKRWNAELEDAGVVFSQFAHAARQLWKNA